MLDAVVRKLERFKKIDDTDKARLREITVQDFKDVPSRTDVIVEGENPEHVHLIASGFACRYNLLDNGKRQIVAFLLPGDFCDLYAFFMQSIDHCIATLAASRIVALPKQRIYELLERSSLAEPMLMSRLVDEATLRAWITNIGRRPARQRTAHLFCELHARFEVIGMVDRNGLELPLTQVDLADSLGLSLVHMNRSLQSLREQQLISLTKNKLVIRDIARLRAMCGFTANYLHLDERSLGAA